MHRLSESVNRKFIEEIDVSDWEVETDAGWADILSSNKTIPYEIHTVVTESGKKLQCADTHILFDSDLNEIFARDCLNKVIQTIDGPELVTSVSNTHVEENMYDLSVDSDDHRYYTNGFLSHNSTTCAVFLCHYIIFNDNKTCAILANKAATSREILSRVQSVYEYLPSWLKHGVTEWNKGSFQLENGSRILASATSSSAIRGFSINCTDSNAIIIVKHKQTNEIREITMGEFEKTLTQEKRFLNIISNENWEVLTPNGWSEFSGLMVSLDKEFVEVTLKDKTIRCTPEHRLFIDDKWIEAKELSHEIVSFGKAYDLLDVEKKNQYYTSGFISHNCAVLDEFAFVQQNLADEFFTSVYPTLSSGKDSKLIVVSTPNGMNHFYKMWNEAVDGVNGFDYVSADWRAVPWRNQKWADDQRNVLGDQKFQQEFETAFIGASNTLITGSKLTSIPVAQPIFNNSITAVYAKPDHVRKYCMCVDVSRGTGGDYSAFVVFDVTEIPYKVVFKYRNNSISSMLYPNLIHKIAQEYNNCTVLVESNDVGESVAAAVYFDLEYEEVIFSRAGEIINWGGGANANPGLRTTTKTKRIGCDILKQLIENDKLIINDYDILYELSNFVVKGKSYEADVGNDDLVMCLVMFAYLTTTSRFSEITDQSVRDRIIEERRALEEQEMMPIGYFNDGSKEELEDFKF